jgi:hypothetical protein
MSLISAAIIYVPIGPSPSTFAILGTPVREYTIALVFASAALLALGSTLTLHKKTTGLVFSALLKVSQFFSPPVLPTHTKPASPN